MNEFGAVNKADGGFSLLETIVAFAILAMVLAATAQSISQSSRGLREAREAREIEALAALVLAGIEANSDKLEAREGKSENGLRWRLKFEPLPGRFLSGRHRPAKVVLTIFEEKDPDKHRTFTTYAVTTGR